MARRGVLAAVLMLVLAAPLALRADNFTIGASSGGFEAGLGGMIASGDVRLVTGFGSLLPTEGAKAVVMTTEPNSGAAPADADASTLRIENFTIPAGAGSLRLDYVFLTDELNPSLTNDRFRVKLVLVTAGGEEILLTADTFGTFFPAPWTGYERQTGFQGLEADVSAHAGGGAVFSLELRVEDTGDGRTNSAVFVDNLRFADPGAPVANINTLYSAIAAGGDVTFDGSGSTDDGTIVSYDWNFANGLLGFGQSIPVPYAQPGIYQVRLTVTDNDGLTDSADATVVVDGENRGPVITSTPGLIARVGQRYQYDVEASDSETPFGDVLAYSLTAAPAGMSIDPATGLILWRPLPTDKGDHTVTVLVEDSLGLFDTQTYTLSADNSTFIIASDDNARLYYAKSNGDGTWSGYKQLADLPGAAIRGVAINDFDNDGDFDFLAPEDASQLLVHFFENDGSDNFTDRGVFAKTSDGSGAYGMTTGDYNHDGNADFVISHTSANISIGLGNGDGTFVMSQVNTGFGNGRGIDTADFDHDGNLDFMRTDTSARAHYWRGNGAGGFTDVGQIADSGGDAYGLTAGDFNNDGHPDFIANSSSSGDALLYRGNGDGTFQAGIAVPSIDFNNYGKYDSYDFNGDGNEDLITTSYTSRVIRYYPGNGDGTFGAAVTVGTTPGNILGASAPPAIPPAGDPRPVVTPEIIVAALGDTVDLSGENSTDDGSIVAYDWDFDDSTTGAGVDVSHDYAAEKEYVVKLKVTDDDAKKATGLGFVRILGPPPVADAGGPYVLGEAEATGGIYTVQLDGSASSDADGPVTYQWDAGALLNETFSGAGIDPLVWDTSAGFSLVGGEAVGIGAGSWSNRFIGSDEIFQRPVATSYVGRIVHGSSSGNMMWGLKNTTSNFHYGQMPYAIYFANGALIIYEDGSSRGQHATYIKNVSYDVRIDVKPGSGAKYYFRQTGLPQWTLLRDSSHSSASEFRLTATIHSGTFRFDDMYARRLTEEASKLEKPTVNYVTEAIHSVSLTVADGVGQTDTDNTTVTVAKGAPPVADPGGPYTPGETVAACNAWTVAFDGTASSDDSGKIFKYQWTFGDGATATGATPTHTYAAGGTYNVGLTVTDHALQTHTAGTTVTTTPGAAPVANTGAPYIVDEAAAQDGLWTVNFNGAGSSDDVGICDYAWNFGDGGTGSGQNPTYKYAAAGSYTVTLTVRDNAHQSHVATGTVTVNTNTPPVANAGPDQTVDETVASSGKWTVNFDGTASTDNATASDHGISTYHWDFGDGLSGTGATPTHLYDLVGTYTVTLTVTDHGRLTDSDTMTVTVNDNASPVPNIAATDVAGESFAVGGNWTVPFDASGSTDDFGIFTYEWDFGDSQTGTGVNPSHVYDTPGDYVVTLTVTDHADQSVSTTHDLAVVVNDPPVADAGGPYTLTEAEASFGVWTLNAEGNGSTDDVGIFDYAWELIIGDTSFDFGGTVIDDALWQHAGASQNEKVTITGANAWGNRYFFSRDSISRVPGNVFQAQVRPTNPSGSQNGMFGFKNTSSNFSYTQMPHAIYFTGGTTIQIYENGSPRGSFGSYTRNVLYDIRITLKAIGALYEFKEAAAATWTVLYDSNSGNNAQMTFGAAIHAGTYEFDNAIIRDRKAGTGPLFQAKLNEPGVKTLKLTVRDNALQAHTDTTTVTVLSSPPPVADAGGPYQGGVNGPAVFFDGSGSTDNFRVVNYLWDFDAAVDSDGDGNFTNDINAVGRRVIHTYPAEGTFTATLTVTDNANQKGSAAATVNIVPNMAPRAITVPLVSSDTSIPHETYNGKQITLKGVVYDADPVSYVWDFGDGTNTGAIAVPASARGKLMLQATHTYPSVPDGTPFVARLTVTDSLGNTGTDIYNVIVREKSLNTEVNIAIDEALWYMHKAQETTGRWPLGTHAATAGSSLNAFEANSHQPEGDPGEDPYVETVRHGLDWLFTRLMTEPITSQAAGSPDTNGNGIGIRTLEGSYTYQGGMIMDGIITSGTPDRITSTSSTSYPAIKGMSYRQVVQEMVESYAYGQTDSGGGRGSWRYSWNSGLDNSAAQWGAIGMIPAERNFGVTIPSFVKPENLIALATSQHSNGQFGYTGTGGVWGTASTTASGMVQLALDEVPSDDLRWTKAENHMRGLYSNTSGNNWILGPNFYAMFAFTKAMRLAVPGAITTFCDETPCASGGPLDWYADPVRGFAPRLVSIQRADGSWVQPGGFSGAGHWQQGLITAWGTLILTQSLFEIAPVANAGKDRVWGVDIPLTFDGSGSFHPDPFRHIVLYEWDFDGDGVYDFSSTEPTASFTYTRADYPEAGLPQDVAVRLRVTDNKDKTDTDTAVIKVAVPPHPPVAAIATPVVCTAGLPCSLDGSGSFDIDPGDSIVKYEWELDGDGVPNFAEATGVTISHVFPSPGTVNAGLKVTDNGVLIFGTAFDLDGDGIVDKGADEDPGVTGDEGPDERLTDQTFVIANVEANQAPVADAGGPYTVVEGDVFELDGSNSSDPNGDPITHAWDLDNNGDFSDASGAKVNHSYPDVGVFTVGLEVSDTLLGDQTTAQVTVSNAPPMVEAGPNQNIDEGGTVTLAPATFTDAGVLDTHTATIDWGDGTSETGALTQGAGSGSVAGSHVYADDGVYTVTVTVIDDDGDLGSDIFTVTVGNLPPMVEAGPSQTISEGGTVTLAPATFTDAGVLDTHTATIDWGDGTSETGALTQGAGSGSVAGSHVYPAAGVYTVTVVVTDDDGGSGSDLLTVTVEGTAADPVQTIFDLGAAPKDSKVDIWWTPVAGATGYNIYGSTVKGGPYTLKAGNYQCDFCAWAEFGLTNGTTYYYVVKSISGGVESLNSNEASAMPQATVIRRRR